MTQSFNKRTDNRGRYSGSGRWQDEFGEALPDFWFQVEHDGRKYGPLPYVHADHNNATIVCPWPVPCATPKGKRGILLFITLTAGQNYKGFDKWLYDGIESLAESIPDALVKPKYDKYVTVRGADATLDRLCKELKELAKTCRAVDLIYVTHGSNQALVFADGAVDNSQLSGKISHALTDAERARLRVVYSTACYGRSHIGGWLSSGFRAASGSRKVSADAACSYAAFLKSWADGKSFKACVQESNANVVCTNGWDAAAEAKYALLNGVSIDANSFRDAAGETALSICAKP